MIDVDVLQVDRRQRSGVADTAVARVLVGRRGNSAGGEANLGCWSVSTSQGVFKYRGTIRKCQLVSCDVDMAVEVCMA